MATATLETTTIVNALRELYQSAEYVMRNHGQQISGTAKLSADLARAREALTAAGVNVTTIPRAGGEF